MKKLLTVLMLTLALNFIAVAGGVGWLWNSQHLDREKVLAIKTIMFPTTTSQPTTQEAVVDATTQPSMRLEELLAKVSGRTATEQVEFIQHSFDEQLAQLDRRQRELSDLKRQTDLAQQKLTADRATMATDRTALDDREKQATALASDQGFQNSLTLYNSMNSKQVKQVFVGLDDTTIVKYLQAMQPRTSAKVVKEFKTPEETARIQKIIEMMRQAAPPATAPTAAASP